MPKLSRKEVRCNCNAAHRVMEQCKDKGAGGICHVPADEPKLYGGIGAGGYEMLHWVKTAGSHSWVSRCGDALGSVCIRREFIS